MEKNQHSSKSSFRSDIFVFLPYRCYHKFYPKPNPFYAMTLRRAYWKRLIFPAAPRCRCTLRMFLRLISMLCCFEIVVFWAFERMADSAWVKTQQVFSRFLEWVGVLERIFFQIVEGLDGFCIFAKQHDDNLLWNISVFNCCSVQQLLDTDKSNDHWTRSQIKQTIKKFWYKKTNRQVPRQFFHN